MVQGFFLYISGKTGESGFKDIAVELKEKQ